MNYFDLVEFEAGPLYEIQVEQGGTSITACMPAGDVEMGVAQHLVINPVLEGCQVFLQFHSPGGGFSQHAQENCAPAVAIRDLVEGFLFGDDLPLKSDSPDVYAEEVAALAAELGRLAKQAQSRSDRLCGGPKVDAFSPDFMPDLTAELKRLGIT